MEIGSFIVDFPIKIVIFHSFLYVYQLDPASHDNWRAELHQVTWQLEGVLLPSPVELMKFVRRWGSETYFRKDLPWISMGYRWERWSHGHGGHDCEAVRTRIRGQIRHDYYHPMGDSQNMVDITGGYYWSNPGTDSTTSIEHMQQN